MRNTNHEVFHALQLCDISFFISCGCFISDCILVKTKIKQKSVEFSWQPKTVKHEQINCFAFSFIDIPWVAIK